MPRRAKNIFDPPPPAMTTRQALEAAWDETQPQGQDEPRPAVTAGRKPEHVRALQEAQYHAYQPLRSHIRSPEFNAAALNMLKRAVDRGMFAGPQGTANLETYIQAYEQGALGEAFGQIVWMLSHPEKVTELLQYAPEAAQGLLAGFTPEAAEQMLIDFVPPEVKEQFDVNDQSCELAARHNCTLTERAIDDGKPLPDFGPKDAFPDTVTPEHSLADPAGADEKWRKLPKAAHNRVALEIAYDVTAGKPQAIPMDAIEKAHRAGLLSAPPSVHAFFERDARHAAEDARLRPPGEKHRAERAALDRQRHNREDRRAALEAAWDLQQVAPGVEPDKLERVQGYARSAESEMAAAESRERINSGKGTTRDALEIAWNRHGGEPTEGETQIAGESDGRPYGE